MISTPKLSQIPIGMFTMGSIGYALGYFAQVNQTISASVLAIASLANHILFAIADRTLSKRLNVSPNMIYIISNSTVCLATTVAAKQLDLISRRMTCMCIFATSIILLGNLRILATETSAK